jgi:hypothetical protein
MTAPKPSIVPPVIIRIENAVAATTSIAFEKGKWVCAVVISQARIEDRRILHQPILFSLLERGEYTRILVVNLPCSLDTGLHGDHAAVVL